MKNILTLDVEDWQQSTLDNTLPISSRVYVYTSRFMDILKRKNVKATLFIQGMVAEKYPDLVKRAVEEGHEIASHSYAHRAVFRQGKDEFEKDLKKSLRILEDIAQVEIKGYRAPDFSITKKSLWALEVLAKSGIEYDSSIFPIRNPRYGIPGYSRFPICINNGFSSSLWEFPLSTIDFLGVNIPFAGGGYFRLYPYRFIKWGIRKLNKQGFPAILYFHPYELDPNEFDKVEKKIPLKLKFTQRLNRSRTEEKLEALLNDFSFIKISDYIKLKTVV